MEILWVAFIASVLLYIAWVVYTEVNNIEK